MSDLLRKNGDTGKFPDDDWREILYANGFHPSGVTEEVWRNPQSDLKVKIDVDRETEEPYYQVITEGVPSGKWTDTEALKSIVESKDEKPQEPQLSPEEIKEQDAKFLKDLGITGGLKSAVLTRERALEIAEKLEVHAESAANIGNADEAKTFSDKAKKIRKEYKLDEPSERSEPREPFDRRISRHCPYCDHELRIKPYANPTVPPTERFMTYCDSLNCDYEEEFGTPEKLSKSPAIDVVGYWRDAGKLAGHPPRFSFSVPMQAAGPVSFHLAKAGMKDFEVTHFKEDEFSVFEFPSEPEMHVAEEIVKAEYADQIRSHKGLWGMWAEAQRDPSQVKGERELSQKYVASEEKKPVEITDEDLPESFFSDKSFEQQHREKAPSWEPDYKRVPKKKSSLLEPNLTGWPTWKPPAKS